MVRNNLNMFRHLSLIVILLARCSATDLTDVSLENALLRILKVGPPDSALSISKNDVHIPTHMLELYHKYTTNGKASGETVRSVTPIPDPSRLHVRDMLVFNISQVGADEEVRLGQLLLHRRRLSRHPHPLHPKLLAPPYRVRVFQVVSAGTRARTLPLASIPVTQVTRGGWHSLDITSAVRELMLSSADTPSYLTLGVRFEAPKAQILSPSHFLDHRDNTSAFLMVFSKENADNKLKDAEKKSNLENLQVIAELTESAQNHIKKRHHSHHAKSEHGGEEKPRRHKHKTVHDGDGDIKELIAMKRVKKLKRHRKLFDGLNIYPNDFSEKSRIESNLIDELLESSDVKRPTRSLGVKKAHRRRSIYDNELPYEKLHLKDTIITTTEVTATATAPTTSSSTADDAEQEGPLIPYPPGMERKKKRRGRRNKRRQVKIEKIWEPELARFSDQMRPQSHLPAKKTRACSLRPLHVNFSDLGWGGWIVAPSDFEANYCFGSCVGPAAKNMTTNHAIVQSLMHSINNTVVPAPCCVPHSLGSITILYIESDNSLILKNLLNMTVKTCSCR